MPCYHPMSAWRASGGTVTLGREPPDANHLRLPCGKCIGCRSSRALGWALRCQLELQQHDEAVFTTLTYNDENLPPTLRKRDLQLWLKRLRRTLERSQQRRELQHLETNTPASTQSLRFFGCGEYGETTGRPHYHAILFNLGVRHRDRIEDTWGLGHTRTEEITPARIAYTAGYVAKKIAIQFRGSYETVDPDTGEVTLRFSKDTYHNGIRWQDQFIQMSRRPGIGGQAREHWQSWRLFAVLNGTKLPVPRYLHEAWKQQADNIQKEELELEKIKLAILRDTSEPRLQAGEKNAEARQAQRAASRKY